MPPYVPNREYDEKSDHDLLVELSTDMAWLKSQLGGFVTKTEFAPVRLIAFGLVMVSVMAVITALISLVVGVRKG